MAVKIDVQRELQAIVRCLGVYYAINANKFVVEVNKEGSMHVLIEGVVENCIGEIIRVVEELPDGKSSSLHLR